MRVSSVHLAVRHRDVEIHADENTFTCQIQDRELKVLVMFGYVTGLQLGFGLLGATNSTRPEQVNRMLKSTRVRGICIRIK